MTDKLVFAAIADDDTGASDLAGMLAEEGLRTLLVIDLPTTAQFLQWTNGYDAVVMAEGTRHLSPLAAQERTRAALRLLVTREPRVLQIKYCSTFDSTAEGNIGPTIDAALDELNEQFTIAVPALPVNGRTTYQGYHFVNQRLLSESPMREHPLTPMTNSNLVDLLSTQTRHKVGLASYPQVEAGVESLKQCFQKLRLDGVAITLVDCVNDEQLGTICKAAADLKLVTGSSAFGIKMPAIWRERGWISKKREKLSAPTLPKTDYGSLIVAGSCSIATRQQNEWLAAAGTVVYSLNPRDLVDGTCDFKTMTRDVRAQLAAGQHCLVSTSSAPEEVRLVQDWAITKGLTVAAVGEAITSRLAELVLTILSDQAIGGLIVAGGETSGALCRRLELGALQVGRNIEPGIPLCFSLGRFQLPVVLKSGNFGGPDFYGKALRALEANV